MQIERFLRDSSTSGLSSRTLIVNTLRQGRGQSGTTFGFFCDFTWRPASKFRVPLTPADRSRYPEENYKPLFGILPAIRQRAPTLPTTRVPIWHRNVKRGFILATRLVLPFPPPPFPPSASCCSLTVFRSTLPRCL